MPKITIEIDDDGMDDLIVNGLKSHINSCMSFIINQVEMHGKYTDIVNEDIDNINRFLHCIEYFVRPSEFQEYERSVENFFFYINEEIKLTKGS